MCSKWLGSGISRDVNDLRRVQQLLVTSLDKLNKDNMQQIMEQPSVTFIYGEAVSTLESLAVLMAWADVSISTHRSCYCLMHINFIFTVIHQSGSGVKYHHYYC